MLGLACDIHLLSLTISHFEKFKPKFVSRIRDQIQTRRFSKISGPSPREPRQDQAAQRTENVEQST
jgi:hypothetical protein